MLPECALLACFHVLGLAKVLVPALASSESLVNRLARGVPAASSQH